MTYTQDQRDHFSTAIAHTQHSHRHPGGRACRPGQNRAERVAGGAQRRSRSDIRRG